ncbi:MAG TPA: MarR family transcriptional regulator [Acidimicrobiales bacterium]|jgi:DNA-binding MarR family transcriptional regulator
MAAKAMPIGEEYRGEEGRIGFLLVQAHHAFAAAMDVALRPARLSRAQFGTLSVVVRQPGLSAADLARAVMLTPQAVNLLVTSLEREGLVERRPHPSHGRILEIHPTREGIRRLNRAYPVVIELEDRISAGLGERELTTVKRWLVQAAVTLTAG